MKYELYSGRLLIFYHYEFSDILLKLELKSWIGCRGTIPCSIRSLIYSSLDFRVYDFYYRSGLHSAASKTIFKLKSQISTSLGSIVINARKHMARTDLPMSFAEKRRAETSNIFNKSKLCKFTMQFIFPSIHYNVI